MWRKHCTFSHKTLWIARVSLNIVFFFLWFFQNYLCSFYFFNIELIENYNYKSLQIRLNHVGKHCSFHHKTLWIATMFPTWFFCYFFSKIVFVDFIFLILSLLRIYLCNFFSLKHCELLQCFQHDIFLFFPKLFLSIFFNIELVKNYNYNKAKSYRESVVAFLTKHCELLQYLSKWFFYDFFLK